MMPESFKIRELNEKDIGDWLRLRKLLWDGVSEAEHKAEMLDIYEHSETQLVLVAQIGFGRIVGFLEASIRPFVEDCHSDNVGYLEGWYVEPEYRKNGIGRMLVAEAENWARRNGATEMASDAEIGNEMSLRAHLRIGYEETSRLVHLRKDLV
ncbi:MAG TPA: GNAT family N-acetyltransferase [Pyrinomonadaceae bacterium]|nr:GNAT family N-acetyltransferase [Pyrinomonadaceae bacterium]